MATQRGGLFFLDIWTQSAILTHAFAFYGIEDPTLQIWHERLAHLGEKNLKLLRNMSIGMNSTSAICLCEPYMMGQMKEVPHTTSSKRGTYPMEFVHTDVAGPFPVTGFDGSQYWVTFLDDHTKRCKVIPITNKSEVPIEFQRYLARNKRPERQCHRVRLDNSGENCILELREWLADRGIVVEVTTTD